MTDKNKGAVERLSTIKDTDEGYCVSVMDAYAHLPVKQLYADLAAVLERVRVTEGALKDIAYRRQTCASDEVEAWELQDVAKRALSPSPLVEGGR